MGTVLAGAALGALVGVALGRWRGTGLGVAYGILAAGGVWALAGIIAGNRAEEMAAIPYLVAGGVAFWFVAAPAAIGVLVLERRRARARASDSADS